MRTRRRSSSSSAMVAMFRFWLLWPASTDLDWLEMEGVSELPFPGGVPEPLVWNSGMPIVNDCLSECT